jgi:ATP-dependent protease HslVU (ClpYQ) peptidase subunit
LYNVPDKTAEEIAKTAMEIAASMCVYTNDNFKMETIDTKEPVVSEEEAK